MRDMYIRPSLSYCSKNDSISYADFPWVISNDYPKKYLVSPVTESHILKCNSFVIAESRNDEIDSRGYFESPRYRMSGM